jgi:hypothetical protein
MFSARKGSKGLPLLRAELHFNPNQRRNIMHIAFALDEKLDAFLSHAIDFPFERIYFGRINEVIVLLSEPSQSFNNPTIEAKKKTWLDALGKFEDFLSHNTFVDDSGPANEYQTLSPRKSDERNGKIKDEIESLRHDAYSAYQDFIATVKSVLKV